MMIELTQKILDALKSQGLDTREIGFKDLIDGQLNLTRPAVNITINSATHKQVTMFTYKSVIVVTMILIIQNLRGGAQGEGQRKEAVYKLIESIEKYLTLQRWDLPLENPLIPQGTRNITSPQWAKAGYQLYELRFWTSYNIDWQSTEGDYGTLQQILAKYWLEPNDTVDVSDLRGSDLIKTI
jgi:hypothetical protein